MSVTPNISEEARTRLGAVAEDARFATVLKVVGGIAGAEAFLVGGAVRDAVIGRGDGQDLDVVVRGASLDELSDALSEYGTVNMVGKSFGVLKFRLEGGFGDVDIAWPRTERAGMSGGYRDFAVQSDPELPIERDLERRDFTVNAIAWRPTDGALVDPFGGLADIEAKVLRAVGDSHARFTEDHSRMLRGMRFACQLGFEIEPETWKAICERMPHIDDMRDGENGKERVVPYETVAKELVKAVDADPAHAAHLFYESGALLRLIPELTALSSCEQSPDHHSEGNVWIHTLLALSKLHGPEFSELFPGERPSAETAIAVLLHDIAKPETAAHDGGKITFYGHAERGAEVAHETARRLRLTSVGIDADRLSWLVKMHLFPNLVQLDSVRRTTLEKYFLNDVIAGRSLLHLACADALAAVRPDGSTDLATLRRLLVELKDIAANRQPDGKPMLSGGEVMSALHLSPGPQVGSVLEMLKEAQLHGEVTTEEQARAFILQQYKSE
jgi:tRNA nucleotidyltransferase/poly(A) polymerase